MIKRFLAGLSRTDGPGPDAAIDRVACLLALMCVCGLLWFGALFHNVEICYSSEYDRYVEKADLVREGTLPRDPYRPLLYPFLAAGLGCLFNDTFAAARTISSLTAGVLLVFTFLAGAAVFNRRVALLSVLALALNTEFILCGVMTTTDMMFSAAALATVFFTVRVSEDSGIVPVILLGISFSVAYFTRYAAVALIPGIVVAISLCPVGSVVARLRRGCVLLVVMLVALAPHFALNTHLFGSPFYNENSKNLVRKVFGIDLERDKTAAPLPGVISVMVDSPVAVTASAIKTAETWIGQGAAAYVAGNKQFLAAALFMVALLVGVYRFLLDRHRKTMLLLIYLAAYLAMICVFMEPFPRLLLPVLPVCLLVAVSGITEASLQEGVRLGSRRISGHALVMVFFLALLGLGIPAAISDALRRTPFQELNTAQLMERNMGDKITVMGSFPFMQRYVRYRYYHLNDDGFLAVQRSRTEYFERLMSEVRENKADYIVVGAPSLGNRPSELLTGQGLPEFLKPVMVGNQIAVYRVVDKK